MACGDLDAIDHVHDLRVLAAQAEPPDQQLELVPGELPAPTVQPVTVTVLVADPNGRGRPISYSLAACIGLKTGAPDLSMSGPPGTGSTSTASQRCLLAGMQVFAEGTTAAPQGWVEVQGTFTASAELLGAALILDAYRGLGGLRVPVQLTVRAGDEEVVGVKWVVFTLDGGQDYVPNRNPVLAGLSVDGAPWPAGAPFDFALQARPGSDGWTLQPQFDPALAAAYTVPTFTGPPLPLKEVWLFDYFSTWGGFSPTTAGGHGFFSSANEPPNSLWLPPNPARLGAGLFWLVARDGRGGEAWLVREATLRP